jgi:hypothetical protein
VAVACLLINMGAAAVEKEAHKIFDEAVISVRCVKAVRCQHSS